MRRVDRVERWWGSGLVVVGAGLLGVVFILALQIVGDPGGYYDRWVPGGTAEGPEASFEWTSSGHRVTFADTTTTEGAELVSWVWDFGDGAESTERSPAHRYAEDGEFAVTLRVVDEDGLDSQAESAIAVERGVEGSGAGEPGLGDLAGTAVDTLAQAAKAGGVVLLVIGMFVVMTAVGGRLLRQGVLALRPLPERFSMRLRPKNLELALGGRDDEEATPDPTVPVDTAGSGASGRTRADTRAHVGSDA